MSYWIAAAGFLSLAFVLAHVVGGGADVHIPVLESDLSDVLKGYVSVIWHGITASMLLCSVLLLTASWWPAQRTTLTLIVVVQYAMFAALFIFYGTVRFQSVLVMPPWIGFVAILLVALAGLYREKRSSMPTRPVA